MSNEFGDFLLVGGAKDEFGMFAIVKFVEFGTHDLVSACLMPQFGGEKVGEGETRGRDGGEFRVDDRGDLIDNAKSVRKESKDSR